MNEVILSDTEFLKFSKILSNLENDYSVCTESDCRYVSENNSGSIVVHCNLDRITCSSDDCKYDRMVTLNLEFYFKKIKEV